MTVLPEPQPHLVNNSPPSLVGHLQDAPPPAQPQRLSRALPPPLRDATNRHQQLGLSSASPPLELSHEASAKTKGNRLGDAAQALFPDVDDASAVRQGVCAATRSWDACQQDALG
jgi:hypothetical protein